MKYNLKIEGAHEPKGAISLKRLALLSTSISKVAEGALRIRLYGISSSKGKKGIILENALNVNLTEINEGSTCLSLEAESFSDTLKDVQLNVFKQEAQSELLLLTPVSLFVNAYNEAISESPSTDLLDKPLLKELKQIQKAFLAEDINITITNQGSIEALRINKETQKKIKVLEEIIQDPKPVIINGKVDMLQYSKQRVTLKTKDGLVNATLNENIQPEEIAPYWGKEVTISGISHFKPDGKFIIEIKKIFKPSESDAFFYGKTLSESIDKQIERQIKEGKKYNALNEITGKWPGDESFEELIQKLNK